MPTHKSEDRKEKYVKKSSNRTRKLKNYLL